MSTGHIRRRPRWRSNATRTSAFPGAVSWWRTLDGEDHLSGAFSAARLRRIATSDWYVDARPDVGAAARVVVPGMWDGHTLATGGNAVPPPSRRSSVGRGDLTPAPHVPYTAWHRGHVAPVDVCGVSFVGGDDEGELQLASDVVEPLSDTRGHGLLAMRRLV